MAILNLQVRMHCQTTIRVFLRFFNYYRLIRSLNTSISFRSNRGTARDYWSRRKIVCWFPWLSASYIIVNNNSISHFSKDIRFRISVASWIFIFLNQYWITITLDLITLNEPFLCVNFCAIIHKIYFSFFYIKLS